MKKEQIIVLVIALTLGLVSCKKVNVPEKVKASFEQKFKNAGEVEWEQEENNKWEAEFEMDEKEMSATFDGNGSWLETETEIESSEVPQAVVDAATKKFPGYKIKEWELIEKPEQTIYEAEMKGENGEKIKVQFDKNGTGLKREKIK